MLNRTLKRCLNAVRSIVAMQPVALVLMTVIAIAPTSVWGWQEPPKVEVPHREIHVPFDDLPAILSGNNQRVFMTRDEYEALLEKSHTKPSESPPQFTAMLSADYAIRVDNGLAHIDGTLEIDVLQAGLQAIELPVQNAGILSAAVDGKPAFLAKRVNNNVESIVLLLDGIGQHRLELQMIAIMQTAAAQQTLQTQLPTAPTTHWTMSVPGNVEIRSGVSVRNRQVDTDANVTRFELVPAVAANSTSTPLQIVMSLNNKLLRETRSVASRGVIIDEIASAYEQVHATFTMNVLYGASDRFRFEVPQGFEITQVRSPLLSRWNIVTDQGKSVLDVELRETVTDRAVIDVIGVRQQVQSIGTTPVSWTWPAIRPLDVESFTAVLGAWLENGIQARVMNDGSLIPIDHTILSARLPATFATGGKDRPALRPIASYFAPTPDQTIAAEFIKPAKLPSAKSTMLVIVKDTEWELKGTMDVTAAAENVATIELELPEGWSMQQANAVDGALLKFDVMTNSDEAAKSTKRIRIALPSPIKPGLGQTIQFSARHTPDGWLDNWEEKIVGFPNLRILNTEQPQVVIAAASNDDLEIQPDAMQHLTPIFEGEKAEYQLQSLSGGLAFRSTSDDWKLTLRAERNASRITAQCYSFLKISPEGLFANYELKYDIRQAKTGQILFSLPESTPSEIAISGIQGAIVKETSSSVEAGRRLWTVQLMQKAIGPVRIIASFQTKLAQDGSPQTLPTIRAQRVLYQTGMIALEGDDELEIAIQSHPRPVDVGELTDAQYAIGNRLLGTFGYSIGKPEQGSDATEKEATDVDQVVVQIENRTLRALPTTLIQQARLLSILSAQGKSHHVASYTLKTTGGYIQADLPKDAKLWSILLDGHPTLPQRDSDRLVLDLASARPVPTPQPIGIPNAPASIPVIPPPSESLRNLILVYEIAIPSLGIKSDVAFYAPKLYAANRSSAQRNANASESTASNAFEFKENEIPVADLAWQLHVPSDLKIVQSNGTVAPSEPLTSSNLFSDLANELVAWGGQFENSKSVFGEIDSSYSKLIPEDRIAGRAFKKLAAPPSAARPMAPMPTPLADEYVVEEKLRQPANEPALQSFDKRVKDAQVPPAQSMDFFGDVASPTPPVPPQGPQFNAPPMAAGKPIGRWMAGLEGLRTLNIDVQLPQTGSYTTFQGFGTDAQMHVSIVQTSRLNWLGAFCAGLLVILWLCIIGIDIRRTLMCAIPIALLIALVTQCTPWEYEMTLIAYWMMGALLFIVMFVALVSAWTLFAKRWAHVLGMLMLAIGFAMPLSGNTMAQTPNEAPVVVKDFSELAPLLQRLSLSSKVVEIPADAIVVPYNPSGNTFKGSRGAEKLLVPYATYQQLWNLANPDRKAVEVAPPTEYSLSNLAYTTTLDRDDSLVLDGRMQIDLHVRREILIPFGFSNAVFTRAEVDGQPAKLKAIDQTVVLSTDKFGPQQFEFTIRIPIQRQGGWRVVQAVVPSAPAAKIALTLPQANTELRVSSLGDRTERESTKEGESFEFPMTGNGVWGMQWRPKVTDTAVDQGLSAISDCLLDIQEDGLRVAWSYQLEFRRSRRDQFEFQLPLSLKVEKVVGNNIRGWTVRDDNGVQRLTVTLLKTAVEREQLTIVASRPERIGIGEEQSITAPTCSLPEAMLQQGRIVLRRSDLLDLVVANIKGLSRMDLPNPVVEIAPSDEVRPIALKPFQAYRFLSRDYELNVIAKSMQSKLTCQSQSILRLTQERSQLESRLVLQVEERPLHSAMIEVPKDWKVSNCTADQPMEYSVWESEGNQVIYVRFATGQQGIVPIVVTALHIKDTDGTANEQRIQAEFSEALPKILVRNATRQQGDFVIQADTGLDIRTEQLVDCKSGAIATAASWLRPEQQSLARSLIHYESANYSGILRAVPKTPIVSCLTVSNIKLTQRALEETIYLEWTIRDAGVRQVEFVLPARWKDAIVLAQLTRRITRTPTNTSADAPVRFQIELQDNVIGQYRVVVQQDTQLPKGVADAPIPSGLTGSVANRLITIENSGRDELIVDSLQGVTAIVRGQSQWSELASKLGGMAAQAYRVNDRDNQFASVQVVKDANENTPKDSARLAYQTKDRSVVETASARIGLAKTTIAVDESGAYRAVQEYRVENSKEPFLELELPQGAQLWSAMVAGAPVKPIQPPGATGKNVRVRLPLVRTQVGDLDYGVTLKYAGIVGKTGMWTDIQFPLIKTININVELSQVRLSLPKNQHWYGFDGTLGRVGDESDFLAGEISYKNKLLEGFSSVLSKSSLGSFSNARAAANAKRVQSSIDEQLQQGRTRGFGRNESLEEQISLNSAVAAKVRTQAAQLDKEVTLDDNVDNRELFNRFYLEQTNGRGQGQVLALQDQNGNFGVETPASKEQAEAAKDDRKDNAYKNSVGNLTNELDKTKSKQTNAPSDDLRQQAMRYRNKLEGLSSQPPAPRSGQQPNAAYPESGAMSANRSFALGFGGPENTVDRGDRSLGGLAAGERAGGAPGGYSGGGGAGGMGGAGAPFGAWGAMGTRDGTTGMPTGGGMPSEFAGAADSSRTVVLNGTLVPGIRSSSAAPNYSDLGSAVVGTGSKEPPPDVKARLENELKAYGILNAQQSVGQAAPAGYMASLDIELPNRGQEFLFTTPRGQLELSVKGVSKILITRLFNIGYILAAGIAIWLIALLVGRADPKVVIAIVKFGLPVLGIASLITGYLPIFGGLLLIIGLLWILGSLARRTQRASAMA